MLASGVLLALLLGLYLWLGSGEVSRPGPRGHERATRGEFKHLPDGLPGDVDGPEPERDLDRRFGLPTEKLRDIIGGEFWQRVELSELQVPFLP